MCNLAIVRTDTVLFFTDVCKIPVHNPTRNECIPHSYVRNRLCRSAENHCSHLIWVVYEGRRQNEPKPCTCLANVKFSWELIFNLKSECPVVTSPNHTFLQVNVFTELVYRELTRDKDVKTFFDHLAEFCICGSYQGRALAHMFI